VNAFELGDVLERRERSGESYDEFLRVDALSAGVYVLPAGGVDDQEPHAEDEVYLVLRGRAVVQVADEERLVQPGSFVFVAAGVDHRFHSITEELALLVVFAPAESQAPPGPATDGPPTRS
jgi:mannose-6-phosphate isomerase-like protein (cupin superfamily)